MRDCSWLETCTDERLKGFHKMGVSRLGFRNIPLWRRLVNSIALGIPSLFSILVIAKVLMAASPVEQFLALMGIGIGVVLWAINREANRRKEFLYEVTLELERRI